MGIGLEKNNPATSSDESSISAKIIQLDPSISANVSDSCKNDATLAKINHLEPTTSANMSDSCKNDATLTKSIVTKSSLNQTENFTNLETSATTSPMLIALIKRSRTMSNAALAA